MLCRSQRDCVWGPSLNTPTPWWHPAAQSVHTKWLGVALGTYGRFGHLSTKIDENTNSNYSFNFQYIEILSYQTLENSHLDILIEMDFDVLENWMSKTIKCVKSFWLDCELDKFDGSSLTPESTFSDRNEIDLKFSLSNFVWNLCFFDLEPTPYCWKRLKTVNIYT